MQGFWAATVVAAMTAALSVLSAFGVKLFGGDLSALADAALFAIVAFGIYKMSSSGGCGSVPIRARKSLRVGNCGSENPVIAPRSLYLRSLIQCSVRLPTGSGKHVLRLLVNWVPVKCAGSSSPSGAWKVGYEHGNSTASKAEPAQSNPQPGPRADFWSVSN
jgi:hypothetical protein